MRISGWWSAVACFLLGHSAWALSSLGVVLVDKKTNQVHMAEYGNPEIRVLKTYHATLGKVVGDKLITDDKKTPEGVYFVLSKRTPPNLMKKFGAMAFPVDYPNPMDRRENKTGFGIMLHSTDDPTRLTKNYDSDGCVVVDNHEIREIDQRITVGLTPMIVYDEMKPEYLKPASRPVLRDAFEKWVGSWQSKDIDGYISHYDHSFTGGGMNLKQYEVYKKSLTKKYDKITVGVKNVRIYQHPKYDVITFSQDYRSFFKDGRPAFISKGTKVLYLRTGTDGVPRIAFEDFSRYQED